jgi:hypothetical protein
LPIGMIQGRSAATPPCFPNFVPAESVIVSRMQSVYDMPARIDFNVDPHDRPLS